jgi:lipopolysaccharide transport system permease protein
VFAECVGRAPGLIIANANYVKKVVFPLEILPWVVLGAVLFHTLASLVVWLVFHLVFFGWPPLTSVAALGVIAAVALHTGSHLAIGSAGVYLRDVGQVVGVLTTALMFVSAIFYPTSAFPPAYQGILHLNPLTLMVEQARDLLFWGVVRSGWPRFDWVA